MSEKEFAASKPEQSVGTFREEDDPTTNRLGSTSIEDFDNQTANFKEGSEHNCSHSNFTESCGHERKLEMPDTYSTKNQRLFNCTELQQDETFSIATPQIIDESYVNNLEPSSEFIPIDDELPNVFCHLTEAAQLNNEATNIVDIRNYLEEFCEDLVVAGPSHFICNVCNTSFQCKLRLEKHYLTHTGEKPFTCEICERRFSHKRNLNTHMFLHSEERKYKCDQCPKKFIQKVHLNEHYRTHTGEKPYLCQKCGKFFDRRSTLNRHFKTCVSSGKNI